MIKGSAARVSSSRYARPTRPALVLPAGGPKRFAGVWRAFPAQLVADMRDGWAGRGSEQVTTKSGTEHLARKPTQQVDTQPSFPLSMRFRGSLG
jgi:hypothetical protein